MSRRRQRGVALLIAIIMFAIATTVAAAITYNKAMAARRAAANFTLEQALQAGMAVEGLASIALEDAGQKNRITLDQDWAQPLPPFEIEGTGVWIQGQVEDLTARFNLNSVVEYDGTRGVLKENTHQVEVFRNLLRDLDIDQRYADLLVDWLDTDIAPQTNGGGEDTLYITQVPPYRPPNTLITHVSELLALPKFGYENYRKIAPFVAALPLDVKANTCTAKAVLLNVTKNETEFDAATLAESRKKNGCFPLKATYLAGINDPNWKNAADATVVEQSRWFRLRTNVRIGTAEFVLYSVLFLEPTNKVRTVQRSFGSE